MTEDLEREETDAAGLSSREQRILEAIILEHISTREPVGSKSLASSQGLDVSSATIRAVMGALAERGLVQKPHTSAGRVPTDAGYRYYVDTLLKLRDPTAPEQQRIQDIDDARGVDAALAEANRTLSRLAHHAAVLEAPRADGVKLRQLELVPLRQDAVLLILVTAEGIVHNRVLEGDPLGSLEPQHRLALTRMSNYLTELARDRTLDELRAILQDEVAEHERDLDELRARALARQALSDDDAGGVLLVDGGSLLLDNLDVGDLPLAKELLRSLEEKTEVLHVLERARQAPGVQIFIGAENQARDLAELSLVAAPYGKGGEVLGAVGVIGPRRMDYARVVPLVELTADVVSRILR